MALTSSSFGAFGWTFCGTVSTFYLTASETLPRFVLSVHTASPLSAVCDCNFSISLMCFVSTEQSGCKFSFSTVSRLLDFLFRTSSAMQHARSTQSGCTFVTLSAMQHANTMQSGCTFITSSAMQYSSSMQSDCAFITLSAMQVANSI